MAYWAIPDLNESEFSSFAPLVAADLGHGAAQP
jgi:hypothetical protein